MRQGALRIRVQQKRNIVLTKALLPNGFYLSVGTDSLMTKIDNALVPSIVYIDKILVERTLWECRVREHQFLIRRPNCLYCRIVFVVEEPQGRDCEQEQPVETTVHMIFQREVNQQGGKDQKPNHRRLVECAQ